MIINLWYFTGHVGVNLIGEGALHARHENQGVPL